MVRSGPGGAARADHAAGGSLAALAAAAERDRQPTLRCGGLEAGRGPGGSMPRLHMRARAMEPGALGRRSGVLRPRRCPRAAGHRPQGRWPQQDGPQDRAQEREPLCEAAGEGEERRGPAVGRHAGLGRPHGSAAGPERRLQRAWRPGARPPRLHWARHAAWMPPQARRGLQQASGGARAAAAAAGRRRRRGRPLACPLPVWSWGWCRGAALKQQQ